MRAFLVNYCPALVESVRADEVGGLQLWLAGGYVFEVFPIHASLDYEHWRFFQPGSDQRHVLCIGNQLQES